MTTKKIVKNKLSKLMIVNKVESRLTSVNKWMTMAMADAVVFTCTFISSYVNISFFIDMLILWIPL